MSKAETDRRYLKVPYAEKDQAKQLGARWDSLVKLWWIPSHISIRPFGKWLLPEDKKRLEGMKMPSPEALKRHRKKTHKLTSKPKDKSVEQINRLADNRMKFFMAGED